MANEHSAEYVPCVGSFFDVRETVNKTTATIPRLKPKVITDSAFQFCCVHDSVIVVRLYILNWFSYLLGINVLMMFE